MKLHLDKELFEQSIMSAAEGLGIDAGIIEKDYFVTLVLKQIVQTQPNVVFKGGTSLSKCYKLIKRFSEDIDFNIECDNQPTEGQRRQLKANIIKAIEHAGLRLLNPEQIHSRRMFNRYMIEYPITSPIAWIKPQVIVETAVHIRSFPNCRLKAASYIYDFLHQQGYDELIRQYELEAFELNVQSAERTLIDKLYYQHKMV